MYETTYKALTQRTINICPSWQYVRNDDGMGEGIEWHYSSIGNMNKCAKHISYIREVGCSN